MTKQRRFGVLFGFVAFVAIVAAALLLGLPDVEDQLESDTRSLLSAMGVDDAVVSVDGQDLSVTLPSGVPDGQTLPALTAALNGADGVRTLDLTVAPPATRPAPDPTAKPTLPPAAEPTPTTAPIPEPTPEQTATAAPEPDPEPTTTTAPEPEPTATTEPEPTATTAPEPQPTATPAPRDPAEVVAGLNLGAIQFRNDTAAFAAGTRESLNGIAAELAELDGVNIEIRVHTDSVGDPDVNLLLSRLRADAIRDYLIRQGVRADSLTARGFGASRPIADNATEQGRQSNRRVELLVVDGN